jgi:predicted permease
MTIWKRIWDRLRGKALRAELDEEMAFHLDALARDLEDGGMSPAEARREALRRFGNPERVQERAREERGFAALDELARNVRFAVRGLRRDLVFSAVFVLTLGLTIGLGATAWAVGKATLWSGLPYPDPDGLFRVSLVNPAFGADGIMSSADGATWERFRDEAGPLGAAVYSDWATGVNLTTPEAAAYVRQQRVGAGYFRTLGVAPARGREFLPPEDVPDGPSLVVLSHGLWQDVFRGDSEILGTTIRLKGDAHTVVGIMPPDFRTPSEADLWTPLQPSTTGEGSGTNYAILARAPEGMSEQEVGDRVAAIAPPAQWADTESNWQYGAVPLGRAMTDGLRTPVLALLGGVVLMLLVGWANLMGLQLARTLRRSRELSTRRALGSGRAALVRQVLTENVVVAVLGGTLGAGLAVGALPWIEAMVKDRLGLWQPLPGEWTLVTVAAVLTLLALAVYALVPLVRAGRPGLAMNVISGARVRGRSRHWGRKSVLAGQLALVTVLLFSAALLARSYLRLTGLDTGFDPQGAMTIQVSLDDARYGDSQQVQAFFDETLAVLEAQPGVSSAAAALSLPYERPLNLVTRHPGSEDNLLANVVYVTPGFFETMGMPLLRGRALARSDGPGTRTVMVANQAYVDRYLEGRDPLTSEMTVSGSFGDVPIVGVVGNVQQAAGWGGGSQPVSETPTLYLSAYQIPSGFFRGIHVWFAPSWIVRGRAGAVPPAAEMRRALSQVAPDLPVARTISLAEVVDQAFARQRLEAGLILVVTLFALLLAGIGIYGVIAQEVEERRGEMGVRMAMGSSPGRAVLTTGGDGLRVAAVGLALGLGLSVLAGRFLESLVWGVPGWDAVSLLSVTVTLGAAAAAASFLPAARIGRMAPAKILRE